MRGSVVQKPKALRSTSVTAVAHAGDLCVACFEAQHFER